jgi:hypothetical protein
MPIGQSIEPILKPSTISAIRESTATTCELLDPGSVRAIAITPARQLTAEWHTSLQSLLLDHRSWFFARKRCLPSKTALLRLKGPRHTVCVEIGFPCQGWTVSGPEDSSGGFFDPVADEMRDLLKSAFPEFASPHRRSLWKAGEIAELRSQNHKFASFADE